MKDKLDKHPEWEAELNVKVDEKGDAKIAFKGTPKALMVMLMAAMASSDELALILDEAVTNYEKYAGEIALLKNEADEGERTTEEFEVFWARVEDKARSIKNIFKSDYYKYKDAIDDAAKEVNPSNWLIKKAQDRISSYSQYSGD